MDVVVLALFAAASLTAMWFFCLRPMWRGHCVMGGAHDAQLQGQIAELQEEIRVLRISASVL